MTGRPIREMIHDRRRSILGVLHRPMDDATVGKLTNLPLPLVRIALGEMRDEWIVFTDGVLWGKLADRNVR